MQSTSQETLLIQPNKLSTGPDNQSGWHPDWFDNQIVSMDDLYCLDNQADSPSSCLSNKIKSLDSWAYRNFGKADRPYRNRGMQTDQLLIGRLEGQTDCL